MLSGIPKAQPSNSFVGVGRRSAKVEGFNLSGIPHFTRNFKNNYTHDGHITT